MKSEFELAVAQIAADKGLSTDDVLEAVRVAVESAYRDLPDALEDIVAAIDGNGHFTIFAHKTVVDVVADESAEIDLAAANEIDPSAEVGEVVQIDITPSGFSRIAAQKARQAMLQTLKQSERLLVIDRYINHVGELMVGKIARVDNRGAILDCRL